MRRYLQPSDTQPYKGQRSSRGGHDRLAVSGWRLKQRKGAGERDVSVHVIEFSTIDIALIRVGLGIVRQFRNRGMTGTPVRPANGFLGIEPMLVRPDCPNTCYRGSRIDEHSIEVKQHSFALNFDHAQ